MASREFQKNSREIVRITPSKYEGHDLIDIRVYAKDKKGDIVPTRKGVSLNIDTVPELIDSLIWALGQSCDDNPEKSEHFLCESEASRLASIAFRILKEHGSSVHWDTAERMVLPQAPGFSKWDLHYVLFVRNDLFQRIERGCYRARTKST